MKFSATALSLSTLSLHAYNINAAFVPHTTCPSSKRQSFKLQGYLDDLSKDLYGPSAVPDVEQDKYENNVMSEEDRDRYGPGDYKDYVEFDEYDGGDGQMGVAGDGEKGLDKSDFNTGELASQVTKSMDKSKMRSARVAWGSSSGYADELMQNNPSMDISRAQQLENWQNQQELRKVKERQKYVSEQFDTVQENAEADWRQLASFGVERNEDFNLDESFGKVEVGAEIEGTLELQSRAGGFAAGEVKFKNPYMGFADFRAAITPESPTCFSVTPMEGSIKQREETTFTIKFKPDCMGTFTGHFVLETEDFKKTWALIGST